MTTDLFFVLDLLDRFPDMKLLADLSHFLVGREFAWPVDDDEPRLHPSRPRQCLGLSWPRRQPRAGPDRDLFPASPDVVRPVPRLVGIRLPQLAPARRCGRGLLLRLRARAEALRDHRPRRQRPRRPLGRRPPHAREGARACGIASRRRGSALRNCEQGHRMPNSDWVSSAGATVKSPNEPVRSGPSPERAIGCTHLRAHDGRPRSRERPLSRWERAACLSELASLGKQGELRCKSEERTGFPR